MGYRRWREADRLWTDAASIDVSVAEYDSGYNAQWCVVDVLNALLDQVYYLNNYVVGRAKVIDRMPYSTMWHCEARG
ncbi:hypothetical protein F4141_07300 [Candidatus Poribacteria bacterium]|nr:hypothetical protein [Candidatus Poribacteria bacterium]